MGKKKKKHKGKKVATSEFFSTPPQEFVQQGIPSRTMRSGRYASECAATPESDSEECGIPAELFVKMSPAEEKRQKKGRSTTKVRSAKASESRE